MYAEISARIWLVAKKPLKGADFNYYASGSIQMVFFTLGLKMLGKIKPQIMYDAPLYLYSYKSIKFLAAQFFGQTCMTHDIKILPSCCDFCTISIRVRDAKVDYVYLLHM